MREENTCRDNAKNWVKTSWLEGEVRRTELDAKVLGGCIIEREEEGEEYLRVEKSFLNSTDEGEAGGKLTVVVLGKCHEKKNRREKRIPKRANSVTSLSLRRGIMTEGVEVFLLDELDGELIGELNRKMFNTKLLSSLNFSGVKGFFDIKLLSRFSFAELLNLGNITE
jgi:hypothetical protein